MAENQHRLISGYRELDENEIALMNRIKVMEQDVLALCVDLRTMSSGDGGVDGRFLSLGITEIETGFMHLVRSVARPPRPDGLDWVR